LSTPAFDPAAEGWRPLPPRGFPVLVGPFWAKPEGQHWRYGFLAEPRHANVGGVVHGGMLMTFVDDLLGMTVWEACGRVNVSTIQLNTQFIAPARPGDFVEFEAEILRRTRSVVFIRGRSFVGERTVTHSDGVWKILGTA
jgi:acyl-coenzyme A thioesterase PaaI-like protein